MNNCSLVDSEGWEPQKKPKCRSCGGETAQILASYGLDKLQFEWECMKCGKSFKDTGNNANEIPKKKFKKPFRYNKR